MSENSKIEWTDHTFNPWWGCRKVSAGCKNCYAEALDNRWKGGHWGPGSDRKPMSEKYWQQPVKWNAAAEKEGIPARVFCASMADVFEDHYQVVHFRERLFELILKTPWLTWQLLTKRPENIMGMLPRHWIGDLPFDGFPQNVWIGTSVENQEAAEERIPHLLRVPASVRFLSCEPLLGPVDFSSWTYPKEMIGIEVSNYEDTEFSTLSQDIHWVIAGGESGPHARPMHPEWVRSLRDQCQSSGTSFFLKQWGEWYTDRIRIDTGEPTFQMWRSHQHFTQKNWADQRDACIDAAGKICHIGKDFMDAVYPVAIMQRIGKGRAGRLLDGREWKEFPLVKDSHQNNKDEQQ